MNNEKKQVDVCFSPVLYPYYATDNSIVVVIDILRATSVICAAFEHGVEKILPVASKEEAIKYRAQGYLIAGERDGVKIEGFDLGNSPFSYIDGNVKGKKIAFTTTNGTLAINAAKDAYRVVIGSFLNFNALTNWLIEQNRDVILLSAGYKAKLNFEDAIFAGAVAEKLIETEEYDTSSDSVFVAMNLYKMAINDMFTFLRKSSHRIRLKNLDLKKDVKYCFSPNQTNVIPILYNDHIVDIEQVSGLKSASGGKV